MMWLNLYIANVDIIELCNQLTITIVDCIFCLS